MTEKPEYVAVQIRAPRGDNDYGLIEEGFYKVEGQTVVLVDNKGRPRTTKGGKPIKELIPFGATARSVAWRLTKANMPDRRSGFNRPLQYFNPGKI
jgi:hypothetical protein